MADAFPTLTTGRLTLREITDDDAPELLRIHGNADHMRWFGVDPMPDLEAARDLIRRFAAWRDQPNPGTRWGMQLHGEPGLIGTCSLFSWHRQWRKCATGYEIAPEHANRGLMREALTCILGWGFAHMDDLNRVEAQVHPDNTASLRLLGKLGFVEEGRLREVGYWGGRHHDLLQLALLRRDWRGVA
ncbi:GNAT family N-acetyltransferase [Ramlibacter algicola]|uniref:GNAT family N-acetyltransferase n=1 Tax=Ramlibacter algicola TaxID=2795217 RepID=A0A934PZL7_9BURK|nr:GNAT family protein [Ramlibacter algicola]MBK0392460.1 GNAT family N-acetyltransferase [Ramlibacter algicola]